MNDILLNQIFDILNRNKLSHAILIESGDEESRLNVAKRIAQAIVCSSEYKPCNSCSNCKKAAGDVHADIALFEGGTTVGSFKVDFVREISRDAAILPNEADRKAYILNRAETMSVSAQNALLKILEEPPAYVSFILSVPSKSAMLPTVLSRVTVYSLTEEVTSYSADAVKATETADSVLSAVIKNNELELLKIATEFEKDKNALKMCCAEIYRICSEALISKLTDKDSENPELALSLSSAKLIKITEICDEIINSANANMNGNLLATLFCSKLIS